MADDLLQGDLRVHDPSSIVQYDGFYYLFCTGWGIQRKRSADLVTWQRLPAVFDRQTTPAWTRDAVPGFRGSMWAPDVIRVGDRFLLYYSVSRFGRQTSAIGLATAESLDPAAPDAGWNDQGPVLQSRNGDPYNAIDPSLLLTADGRLWMAFGSYWKGIHLTELSPTTGKRLDESAAPLRLAAASEIEAATLVERDGWFYLFINHGRCCRGVDSTYHILVGRSRQVLGPYVDREGTSLLEGGGTLVLGTDGRRIGPGHAAPLATAPTERFGFHFYDEARRGQSRLGMASWRWSDDGWPTAVDVQLPAIDDENAGD